MVWLLTYRSLYPECQFVMSWSLPDGSRLERVVTKRFDTTSSLAVFMRAVNPNAAGVLLAKRVILQALKEGAAGNKAQAQRLRAATGSRLRVSAADPLITLSCYLLLLLYPLSYDWAVSHGAS
jgi:hypothetical protein